MSEKILTLIDRVGSNAYAAEPSEDGKTATIEVTAAQASKLKKLLGAKNVKTVDIAGAHVLIRVTIEALEEAAAKNQRTSRGSSVAVDIVSRIQYEVKSPDAANEVTSAWWASDQLLGGIVVNGQEYAIVDGLAKNYYREPEGDAARDWNPERTVYVVNLPTTEGDLQLVSYGVTNLIRKVCGRKERIG